MAKIDPGRIAKALVGGLTAGGGAYTVALQDGALTTPEIVNAVIVGLVAGLVVWTTPNADPAPKHDPNSVFPEEPPR